MKSNQQQLDRRHFLQLMAAAPLLSLSPSLLAKGKKKPLLLMVELKGGNDALNTLVPYEEPNYYRLRPKLAIKENRLLKLGNGFGLNPKMKALLPDWQAGDMAWIQGVGYPQPNHSHFRSIEIWETASKADQYLDEGWVAQLYQQQSSNALQGVIVGSDVGPLGGANFNTLVMQNKKKLISLSKRLKPAQGKTSSSALAHVLDIQNNLFKNAKLVSEKLKSSSNTDVQFPKNKFGRQLESTAQLILSDLDVSLFKVELGSFDTHQSQEAKHNRLLKQLSEGLAAFSTSMKKAGLWDDILIVSYSEFGRRVKENASLGTDHGTAAAHFALGGRVNGGVQHGIIGKAPSLDKLDHNDLFYTTDFRSYYHSIATEWLGIKSPWANHEKLSIIS